MITDDGPKPRTLIVIAVVFTFLGFLLSVSPELTLCLLVIAVSVSAVVGIVRVIRRSS